MSFLFTVSPDFTPDHISGWYIFNTWLQNQTDIAIHLEMYNDFQTQREAIEKGKVDLIYANPFDAAMLVREKGFQPLVKATGKSDEAVIVVNAENSVGDVADLKQGIKVVSTDDPDVQMMGMIMLEPGDLDAENTTAIRAASYILVAKHLIKGEADVGIFLADAYDDLSTVVKKQLKVLVKSQISVINHSLMIGPALLDKRLQFLKALMSMNANDNGQGVLKSLGFDGWKRVDKNEMEFMIDLMDALAV